MIKIALSSYQLGDDEAWARYKNKPTKESRSELLHRFDGIINNTVNKWSGGVPSDVLRSEANILAAKAFDTYDPKKGTALATHVTNSLKPISRTVYTYQNTARLPENLTLKMRDYKNAVSNLTAINGYEPSNEELQKNLKWKKSDIDRIKAYDKRSLMESGDAVSGSFYETHKQNDEDDELLSGIYYELPQEDREFYKAVTGYGLSKPMATNDIMKKFNMNQSQLSYKKRLIIKKVQDVMNGKTYRQYYGGK
jgi:DNA-directed RNA polymerase specialized sigma subunit